MINSLNSFFDHIYCINLSSRSDRWAECLVEFDKHEIKGVERFEAIEGIPIAFNDYGTMGLEVNDNNYKVRLAGRIGCLLSHLEVIKAAKAHNYSNILILEDDVQFVDDIQNRFFDSIDGLPDDWSLLYLGGNEKGTQTEVIPGILKVSNMLMAHAIGIQSHFYDELIELLTKCELPVDVYYAFLQQKYPCYVIYPYLAWQRVGWSDIEQRFRIYDFNYRSPSLNEMLKCKKIK
ncbi:Glycosyltransferase family 25 (LPS biosynthesis protein) [Chitinophaga sp. YR573]|uniref:glycosyltransferase family 25 protein n=1 Tax=Chitinophaga sp. YR573 TaxID=1881040 RepID=UPI0008BD7567|nr:glycosyltransferase family 25 protein [Chitinophaga sp. YR573]SEW17837.1 Glycosyltransferase family 25 (LPS biosynthesis protein) [Chitinophaga sp. YR573]